MMENEKRFKYFRFVLILVFASAALLFSSFGIDRSFWFDECCSVEIAATSWTGIIENLKANAHTPPLYYFLLKPWMALFGANEAGARSLSAVFYLLSIPALFFLGRTLFDRKTALLCAFLFLVNPKAIQFAQFARMYSLLGLLSILSTLFFIRQFYSGHASRKNWAAYAAVNIAGTFTHYWFFFLLLAQGVAYLWLFSKSSFKSFALSMAASVVPFFALWTPVLWVQANNGGLSFITPPGPYILLKTLLLYFGDGIRAALIYAAFLALALLDFHGGKIRLRPLPTLMEFVKQKPFLILLALLTVSLSVPWLISQAKPMYTEGKYPVIVLFAVVLLAASLLARFGNRVLVCAFCALLFLTVTAGFLYRRSRPPVDSVRAITDYLRERGNHGDVLVLAASSLGGTEYYLKRAGAENQFLRFPFPAEMAHHPCWPDLNRWTEAYLENEADRLLQRIDSLLGADGSKVWLLNGSIPKIDALIKGKMDARFQPVDEKLLGESYPPLRGLIQAYQKSPRPATDLLGAGVAPPAYSRNLKMSYESDPGGGYGDWIWIANSNRSGNASTTFPAQGW